VIEFMIGGLDIGYRAAAPPNPTFCGDWERFVPAGPIAGHAMSNECIMQTDELRVHLDGTLDIFSTDEIRQLMAEIEWKLATRPRSACGLFTSNAPGATRPFVANDN
jgi:hypothetical protein